MCAVGKARDSRNFSVTPEKGPHFPRNCTVGSGWGEGSHLLLHVFIWLRCCDMATLRYKILNLSHDEAT